MKALLLLAFSIAASAAVVPEELLRGADRKALSDRVAEQAGQVPSPSAAPAKLCYRLSRLVEVQDPGASGYRKWSDQTSYVSKDMLANIEGIMTPWSWKVRAELLWLTGLAIVGENLSASVALQTQDFPLGDDWRTVWEKPQRYDLEKPVSYSSRILDRDFRATLTWAREPDAGLCKLPVLPGTQP